MNLKELMYKTGKGALSGVVAIAGGLLAGGLPMNKQAAWVCLGAILSAALHGGANAIEQYMKGPGLR